MTVLRDEDFDTFLSRKAKTMNGLLIHGADEAAVSLLARQATKQLGGEPQRLDVSACKSSPGEFFDRFLSLSMFGDRETLLLEDADETCLKFLEPAFRFVTLGNFAVILCSALGKTSKLRSAAEESNLFACLAVYEEDEAKLQARIRKLLMGHGLSWGTDAEEEFYSTVGDDRALVTGEAEKLALYAHGKTEISVDDVKAICGDTAEFYADDLTDAILAGDLELTDHVSTSMGPELRSFFPLFQLHIAKLQTLAVDMERGLNADSAVRGAKPPIFFKRKPVIIDQLKRISLQNLMDIQAAVQETTLLSRKNADLSEAINSRALLAIARQCRARN